LRQRLPGAGGGHQPADARRPRAAIRHGDRALRPYARHRGRGRRDGGPDAAFSLEPAELEALVRGCRTAWAALGRASYDRAPSEAGNAVFRRSLYIIADIAAGEEFTPNNVRSIRPGFGLAPKHLPHVIGRRAAVALKRGTPLSLDHLAPEGSP
jgi:sialic acid synthase SpsE